MCSLSKMLKTLKLKSFIIYSLKTSSASLHYPPAIIKFLKVNQTEAVDLRGFIDAVIGPNFVCFPLCVLKGARANALKTKK